MLRHTSRRLVRRYGKRVRDLFSPITQPSLSLSFSLTSDSKRPFQRDWKIQSQTKIEVLCQLPERWLFEPSIIRTLIIWIIDRPKLDYLIRRLFERLFHPLIIRLVDYSNHWLFEPRLFEMFIIRNSITWFVDYSNHWSSNSSIIQTLTIWINDNSNRRLSKTWLFESSIIHLLIRNSIRIRTWIIRIVDHSNLSYSNCWLFKLRSFESPIISK